MSNNEPQASAYSAAYLRMYATRNAGTRDDRLPPPSKDDVTELTRYRYVKKDAVTKGKTEFIKSSVPAKTVATEVDEVTKYRYVKKDAATRGTTAFIPGAKPQYMQKAYFIK